MIKIQKIELDGRLEHERAQSQTAYGKHRKK
jgi:hypothetical protein